MGKDGDSGGEEGKASGTSDQPPSPMLNPLPIPHHPTGTALNTPQMCCSGSNPSTTTPGPPSPVWTITSHCRPLPPSTDPPNLRSGLSGSNPQGTRPHQGRVQGTGGQEWGCTCPRGAGEQSRGKEQLEQEPIQHLPGQPWVEAVLAPVEAETTAPPAPASIAASTKSRSEPLEPPALALSTGTGAEAGASVMSFWGQE